ncbi:MAG TPA: hypothetical protein DCP78_13275, partial [Sphingobacterium sp.]|nr:hypothetical protein [Sphingobacterium sp.]
MDENKSYRTHPLFRVEQDNHHIITIQPLSAAAPEQLDMIGYLTQFVDLVTFILEREDTVGVVYTCPIQDEKIEYAQLFRQFSSSRSSPSDLFELTSKVLRWETFKKPIVSLFTNNCTAIALATMLWSNYRIASEKLQFGFPESRYGLFTAFGATIYLPALIGTENALSLLTQNKLVSSEEAHQLGLINELAQKPDDCLSLAKNWILHPPSIDANQHTKQMDELGPEAILAIQKKARGLYPGTNAVIELLQKKQLSTPFEAAEQEANLYLHVLRRPEPLSMVRTLHYGVQLAKSPKSINHFEDYSLKKIGILGAGMMGSGIAYEAARAGIEVALKDVTLSQAQRGKAYAKQVCEKSLALEAMTASQGEQLLARIKPTEQVGDLNGSDCIIEAVFE